jgi:glyoxylase-like metal-dependent hydrolase (beta-lactamase superfamily II)
MKTLTAACLVAAGAIAIVDAQQPVALETLHVQNNVYAIFGAGGNVSVQVGADGVLLVDTGLAAQAPAVLAEVRKLSNGPIRFIINTHAHPDHVGGNVAFSSAPVDPRQLQEWAGNTPLDTGYTDASNYLGLILPEDGTSLWPH